MQLQIKEYPVAVAITVREAAELLGTDMRYLQEVLQDPQVSIILKGTRPIFRNADIAHDIVEQRSNPIGVVILTNCERSIL